MKVPPIEKIYEAWSAIADGRVAIDPSSTPQEGRAEVSSSDGAKHYEVAWTDDGRMFASTDNATYWRGYPGYPVVAVLMLQGRLPLELPLAEQYKGINWTALNARHRRDYAAALAEVQTERDIPAEPSALAADQALDDLIDLDLTIKRKLPKVTA